MAGENHRAGRSAWEGASEAGEAAEGSLSDRCGVVRRRTGESAGFLMTCGA